MIDKTDALPVTRQAQLLQISRGSVYYVPAPVSDADLELMRMIDTLHTDYPFAGARMLLDMLRGFRPRRRPPARCSPDEPDGH